jgi:hypothetical protein
VKQQKKTEQINKRKCNFVVAVCAASCYNNLAAVVMAAHAYPDPVPGVSLIGLPTLRFGHVSF